MWVRGAERFKSGVPTAACVPTSDVDVAVVDVSATGCRLRTTSRNAQIGATILLKFADLEEVAGQIVWTHRQQFGVRFTRKLSEKDLDRIAL